MIGREIQVRVTAPAAPTMESLLATSRSIYAAVNTAALRDVAPITEDILDAIAELGVIARRSVEAGS